MTFEYNDHGNADIVTPVRLACESQGLTFTLWFTRGFTAAGVRQAVVESKAQGVLIEGEVPASRPEAVNWPELIFELKDLPIAKGVVTNFAAFVHDDGTPWPEKAQPLIDAGWKCLTECYLPENPNASPDRMDFRATQLGWRESQPVLGLYGGFTLADYPTRDKYRNWSVWSASGALSG